MSDNPRRPPKTHRRKQAARGVAEPSVFKKLDCKSVSYDFTLSLDSMDLEGFYVASRMPKSERSKWEGTCAPKDQATGYHIHFRGSVKDKKIRITVEYVEGAMTPKPDEEEREPFAESFMSWLGAFVHNPTSHAIVHAAFEKSNEQWRSRFNLPFKVTLSGQDAEVAIDGISLVLPENDAGATHAWLTKSDEGLLVGVLLSRRIGMKQFRLNDEIVAINDSTRMFTEEVSK